MRIDARHWAVAGTAALGLHAAAALWVFQVPPHPAATFGGGGMQVNLAPVAGPSAAAASTGPRQDADTPSDAPVAEAAKPRPDTAEAPTAETATPVTPPDRSSAPIDATVPQTVRAETVEAVKPETSKTPVPEAVPVRAPEAPPTPAPTVETVTARDVVTPKPPAPEPRPTPPRKVAADAPKRPAPAEPVKVANATPPSGAPASAADTAGEASSQAAGGQPARSSVSGAPSQVATTAGGAADYMSQLRAWLEKHKEYPSRARRRRIEGTALLVFVMDRDGRVLSHRIERSAGDASLDRAVEDMIERAQPLPPMPDSFRQARLEVRVPVQFMLR